MSWVYVVRQKIMHDVVMLDPGRVGLVPTRPPFALEGIGLAERIELA